MDEGTVLRPSPRVVAHHLRLAALLVAVAAAGWWWRLTLLPVGLGVAAVVQLVWWLRGAVGRVELLPDGVRVRRVLRTCTIGADDVLRFEVRTTLFGRHVRLEHRAGRATRSMRLPAPAAPRLVRDDRFDAQVAAVQAWWQRRHGADAALSRPGRERRRWAYPVAVSALVVAAVLPDRPWGWVAGAEATEIPEVCAALRPTVDHAVESVALEAGSVTPDRAGGCRFTVERDRILVVFMMLYSRSGVHSATSVASSNLRIAFGGKMVAIPEADTLGDTSHGAYLDPYAVDHAGFGSGPDMLSQRGVPIGAVVVARRANVVVAAFLVPDYEQRGTHGAPLDESDAATLIATVRAALITVTLH